MFEWMKRKRVVVVRGDRLSDAQLLDAMAVGEDAPLLLALKECQLRMEDEVLEEVFTGRPDERLRNLARMEGSREVLKIVFGFQKQAMRLLKQQQAEEERRAK